jgi:hypothetical protein
MTGTRKTLAILTLLLVIIVTVPASFVYPVERILFNPVPYEQALTVQDFYQRLPAWLAQITTTSEPAGGASQNALALLNQSGLEKVYALVLSPEWVQSQTESLIEQIMAYLNFEADKLTLKVNLVDLKAAIAASGPASASGQMIRSWPACKAEDLVKLGAILLNKMIDPKVQSTEMPLCRPPDEFLPAIDEIMGVAFTQFANTIPDQVDLMDVAKTSLGTTEQQANLTRDFAIYRALRWTLRLMPVVAVGLFLVLGLLTMQSWRTLLTYTGIGLLAAGFISFFTAILIWLVGNTLANHFIQQLTISASDQMIAVFVKLIVQVGNQFTTLSIAIAGCCFGLGAVAIASPYIYRWLSQLQTNNL